MRLLIAALGGLAIFSASASAAADTQTARYPLTISVSRKASPLQTAVIKRTIYYDNWTIGDEIKEQGEPVQIRIETTDLNGDGRADLIVNLYSRGSCGSNGCSGFAIMATASGFGRSAIILPVFGGDIAGKVVVLVTVHGGMHDLRFDDNRYTFKWNGSEYR